MPLCKCLSASMGLQHSTGFYDGKAVFSSCPEELDTEMFQGQSRKLINMNNCTKQQVVFCQYYFSILFPQTFSQWRPASQHRGIQLMSTKQMEFCKWRLSHAFEGATLKTAEHRYNSQVARESWSPPNTSHGSMSQQQTQ